MRPALVSLVALLAACSSTARTARAPDSAAPSPDRVAVTPVQVPAPPARLSLRAAFGIDGRATACRSLDLQVGDRSETRFLLVHVDSAALGLRAGSHELDLATAGRAVTAEVVVFDAPNHELPDCSDAAPAQPNVRERWTATRGRITYGISRNAPEGENFEATVVLRGVEFRNAAGATRTVDVDLGSTTAGWLPG